MLTLTPHIVRVLDLTEADLQPFRLGRDTGLGGGFALPPQLELPMRDPVLPSEPAPTPPKKPGTPTTCPPDCVR